MAGFGRSNSLSINTSGSLFGNTASQGLGSSTNASQPQSTGGLFGSTSQSQTGGLFGGATSQPPQSGGLFGGQSTAAQPQSGGLFGNMSKPAATAAPSGGLFGSSTAQPQPQQTGGLFGGALGGSTQNQAQNQPPQSGGLFGGVQKPGLFGSSTAQQSTAPLFGSTQTQQNQPTSNLFGSTQQTQPQQQQSTGLFGGMQSQNTSSFGNLGGSQAVQMSAIDAIKGTTRFNDLAPNIQQQIIQLDEGIQDKINKAHKTREALPNHVNEVATIAPDVAYVESFLSTVELGLDNDSANIASLKDLVKKDAEDAYLSFRAIENQALPPQFRYGNTSNLTTSTSKPGPSSSLDDDDPTKPVDLVGYFNRRTEDLGRTLDLYQRQIREIEAHLRTMEAGTVEKAQQLSGSRSRPQDQRRELVGALQAIEGAILDSAKKVGKVRDEVTKQTMGSVGAALL
ncbi:hypothetical protein K458DRAFT_378839 [Lentithecium fluviatile CBS 122367]|uniref:Nucleoporin NUP49/NSP49 n=1 Tax=Lentithecium fluviatile CBS 122367 TaxID=1168545 RepID=A0A6G1IGQ8_9PLEO|nr:hypothetical protein K458DRAFT_378839 [Lentithecium fluviatile CBS 122367]